MLALEIKNIIWPSKILFLFLLGIIDIF